MESARAAVRTETITISKESFLDLLETEPTLKEKIQTKVRTRLAEEANLAARPDSGDVISFFMEQGLAEGTDVLLIDETLCVGCNNCEKACAETHGGVTRLNREAGASFQSMHVPISCRHCEHPHCMKDCPPDAIHRAPDGEVFINESCIGCGNCERNCPYGVIQLAYPHGKKPGLLSWLFLGAGPGPGQDRNFVPAEGAQKKAVKCDMCKDIKGGAACVRACPTGAALRVSPQEFGQVVGAE
jgi:Fe-S-cluster-containing hydrogenase component 2